MAASTGAVVSAASDNIVAVARPEIKAVDIPNASMFFETEISKGVEAGAVCYKTITHDDVITMVKEAQIEQALTDNERITNAMMTMGGQFGSARYLALMFVGQVGAKYVLAGTLLDAKSATRVASGQQTFDKADVLANGAVRSLFKSLATKLPCSLEISGTRQIDLAKIANADDTAFAPNLQAMRLLAPLGLGGEPTFSGRGSQSDTLVAEIKGGDQDATIGGTATWTSTMDAPVVNMSSPGADVVMRRAPYTLKFDGEAVTGTYDDASNKASFALELLEQGTATGGAGQATVTLKNQLAGLIGALDSIESAAKALGVNVKALEQEAASASGAPAGFDPHKATNTLPVPSPGQTDAAYFRLSFDLNMRDDDEKRVSGNDSLGPYNYVVRVKREHK
ncbi:MAG TPA: hypothetical protein VFA59_16625 [Vicinamibacterales bacterium]|nr:hypothetical protein [Vicinamibacterales bacterium]